MSKLLKWIIGIVVLAVLGGLGTWAFIEGRKEMAVERQREAPIKVAPRVSQTADGQTIVTFDGPTQKRIGLKVEPLASLSLQPETIAYGTLQDDPSRVFTIRAPVAGTLRVGDGQNWPKLGDVLNDGAAVGAIEPRLVPTDRLNLASQLASARADVVATAAALDTSRAAWQRLKTLNSEDKSISDRAVQDAEAKVKADEARLEAAQQTAKLIESALAAKTGATGPLPLVAQRGGQVVELPTSIGEAVESGQTLLKVIRFDCVLASATVPVGQNVDPSVSTARILVAGHEDQPLIAERAALAPAVDGKTLGQTFLFRLSEPKLALRPGMAITAYLPITGEKRQGVVIPRSAVVRVGGRAWAYAQMNGEKFTRREVPTDEPVAQGWFAASEWHEGDRVVVIGGQVLLSEEMKSQIQIGEEGEKK